MLYLHGFVLYLHGCIYSSQGPYEVFIESLKEKPYPQLHRRLYSQGCLLLEKHHNPAVRKPALHRESISLTEWLRLSSRAEAAGGPCMLSTHL